MILMSSIQEWASISRIASNDFFILLPVGIIDYVSINKFYTSYNEHEIQPILQAIYIQQAIIPH